MTSFPQKIPVYPEGKTIPTTRLFHISFFQQTILWSCVCLCTLIVFSTVAQATLPGLQGLKWGLLLSDFYELDFDIEEEWPLWNRATAVRLGKQAQSLTDAGSLILVFDEEYGLVKTHWASRPIDRDANGSKGMQLFEQLKTSISEEYGTPDETREEAFVKLQGFVGDFYQCLQEETCGQWESIWATPEGGVLVLELIGIDPGVGFVQMTHQGPNLKDTLERAHIGIFSKEHEI